ncbi:MAG: hypothetical protein IT161_15730 [Bryobacterales bacterium]|nr:hypothetical protein [Bryobacterales bacterium]
MKKMPVGAEPKKVVILTVLLASAGYLFYTNVLSTGAPGGGSPANSTAPASGSLSAALRNTVQPPAEPPRPGIAQSSRGRQNRGEFKPSLRPRRPEERLDPTTVDPTLRLDLLTKLENVKIERVERSLFDFGAVQPKTPEPKIEVKEPVKKAKKMVGPEPPPPPAPPPPPPPKPVAPPVPLKFYGYQIAKTGGARRTFCLDGENILTPLEGETIKGRYKIIRIGLANVVVEDLQFKQQQTLQIEEAPQG